LPVTDARLDQLRPALAAPFQQSQVARECARSRSPSPALRRISGFCWFIPPAPGPLSPAQASTSPSCSSLAAAATSPTTTVRTRGAERAARAFGVDAHRRASRYRGHARWAEHPGWHRAGVDILRHTLV